MAASASVSNMKYFNAMFSNRRNEHRLKERAMQIDVQQRKAITRLWQEKYDLLDELVQINVKTPRYYPNTKSKDVDSSSDGNAISLGEINIDAKLFIKKPISMGGKAKQQAERLKVAPLIDVVGTEAICYPNSEAKKGRHVPLPYRTTRRMEAVKNHHITLDTLLSQRGNRQIFVKPNLFHVQKSKIEPVYRPVTSSGRPNLQRPKTGPFAIKRPRTSML